MTQQSGPAKNDRNEAKDKKEKATEDAYVPSGLERLAAWEQMSLPPHVWTEAEKESFARIAGARETAPDPEPAPKKLPIDELSQETLEGLRMLAARESGPVSYIHPKPPAK